MQLMSTMRRHGGGVPDFRTDQRLADARRAFLKDGPVVPPMDAARDFSSSYLMKLAASLPLADVTAILAAEQVREDGLDAVRKGLLVEAGELFARSDAIVRAEGVSVHARVAAGSFQLPAVAYLAYRTGDLQGALTRLVEAIRLCARLEREFGHDMGFRCLHLVRNIIRTGSYSVPAQATLDQVLALIRTVAGDRDAWTIDVPVTWREPANLTSAQRAALIDEALVNLSIPEVDLRTCELPEIRTADRDPDLVAALHWIHAFIQLRRASRREFAKHAACFLEMDRRALAHAAKQLLRAVGDQLARQPTVVGG